jgi:vancomycin resistance protein YoaR
MRRALIGLAAFVGLAVALATVFGVVALLERGKLPRGTTIGAVAVGGMSESEARAAVLRASARRVRRPIRLLAPDGSATTHGTEIGAVPLVDEAVEAANEHGTVRRVLARLGLRSGSKIALTYRIAPVRAARLANRLDRRFGAPWRDADVVVGDDAVRIGEAVPGSGVDRTALRRALRRLPEAVRLSIVPIPPVVSTGEAAAAAARVERLLAAPRRVRYEDREATLTPRRLRALVRTERADGALALTLDLPGLHASLRPRLGAFETPPRDATFWVGSDRAHVVPSVRGHTLDLERISRSLVTNLDSTTHLARLVRTEPEFTTEEAESLDIRERISEFTTYYPCCAPRVTNIQRAAELLDGTILLPGASFSLNKALGKRTIEKGFVSAPQIFNARLEEAVGGGISQVATTLYNAAFFAGVELVAHQAHQFYISRYPMGREATVSWGGPELIFRNDWPAAILLKVRASSSSITVRFYSRKLGRRVETTTGEPYAYVAPRTIRTRNSSLPPGTVNTIQSAGESGFSVQYTRKVFKGADLVKDERYTVRYVPQNEIVEIGPPKRPRPSAARRPGPKAEQPREATPSSDAKPAG